MMFVVLAAWMRLKYPHIAIGALAASAPVLQFEDVVPPETFYNIVSNDFKVSAYLFSLIQLHITILVKTFKKLYHLFLLFYHSVKAQVVSTP